MNKIKPSIFLILFSFASISYSQNDAVKTYSISDVQGKIWHGSSNFFSDRVIFLKKAQPADFKSATRFTKNGKVIFTDSIPERRPVFSANGEETFLEPGRHSDSTSTKYQSKNDMIHIIQEDMFHYYFKIVIVGSGNLEFLVIDPETYYKNK
jgi:hypothetical protein